MGEKKVKEDRPPSSHRAPRDRPFSKLKAARSVSHVSHVFDRPTMRVSQEPYSVQGRHTEKACVFGSSGSYGRCMRPQKWAGIETLRRCSFVDNGVAFPSWLYPRTQRSVGDLFLCKLRWAHMSTRNPPQQGCILPTGVGWFQHILIHRIMILTCAHVGICK